MEVDYAKRKKKTECAYFGGAACVNERIQEVENELKQLRSQRKEIQEKIEEQKKETLFRAVIASGRCSCDIKCSRSERRTVI